MTKENNLKPEDFAAEETKGELGKNYLMNQAQALQHRVKNLSIEKKKTSFSGFKVKQQNIFGLALIDTGNLVHSAIVLGSSGSP